MKECQVSRKQYVIIRQDGQTPDYSTVLALIPTKPLRTDLVSKREELNKLTSNPKGFMKQLQ